MTHQDTKCTPDRLFLTNSLTHTQLVPASCPEPLTLLANDISDKVTFLCHGQDSHALRRSEAPFFHLCIMSKYLTNVSNHLNADAIFAIVSCGSVYHFPFCSRARHIKSYINVCFIIKKRKLFHCI